MPTANRKFRLSPATSRWLFAVTATVVLLCRFTTPHLVAGFYQDDFFYYLKIVQNLSAHGLSSFDGTHLTNGYHPLWLLLLLVLYKLLPGQCFFLGVQLVSIVAAISFYLGAEKVARRFLDSDLYPVITLLVSMQALLLCRYGMEVTLTLPLAVWLLNLFLDAFETPYTQIATDTVSPSGNTVILGLIASLTVLSRLDAAILIVLLVAAVLLPSFSRQATSKQASRWLGMFLLGFLPLLLIYLAINHHFFHTLTPISGQAKQLKAGLWPSWVSLSSILWPLDRNKCVFFSVCLCLLASGAYGLKRAWRAGRDPSLAILGAMFVFPFVHFLLIAMLSDWAVWPWYFYSFVIAELAAAILLARSSQLRSPSADRQPQSRATTAVFKACAVACLLDVGYLAAYCIFRPNSIAVYESSRQVASFMDEHPGIYAMGDQAGTTAYLSRQPVIQLEGLTMDKPYLEKIKRREPLRDLLSAYRADFYVTFLPNSGGRCFLAREPAQAGPASPASTGSICSAPVATFHRMSQVIGVFPASAVQ